MKINDISVTPVKKYNAPKYPTQNDANQMPEMLRKLPSRWEKNAKIIAAVGLLGAMTLTSCGVLDPLLKPNNTGTENNPGGTESANYLNVAPVFVHGEGTGSIGCVMIAPPVFMSEQEALAIIKNEMKSAGVDFYATPPKKYTATQNKREKKEDSYWGDYETVLGGGKIGLDLYDDKKSVAVTFISMDEAEEKYLPDKDGNTMGSSVTSYRPRELAELSVGDFAKQNGDISIGVFYDPGTDWQSEEYQKILEEYNNYDSKGKSWGEASEQYENDTKAMIEEDLRQQVRDFIEWLQGQGII